MTERKSISSLGQIKSKIKVVFLGDQAAGKTSILLRFMHDKFEEGLGATVGIDFMAKNYTVGNTALRLQLWDTAGQERFRSLIPSYLKDATVTFIVFDLSNEKSFENTREWIELCNQNRKEKCITVLLGNKSDLTDSREVAGQAIDERAKREGIKYYEVSAKRNKNINEAFKYACQQYVAQTLANQATIGNIEFNHSYAEKLQKQVFARKQQNIISIQQTDSQKKKSKKKGCC